MSEQPPGEGTFGPLDPSDFLEQYEPYKPVTTLPVGSTHGITNTAHTDPVHYTDEETLTERPLREGTYTNIYRSLRVLHAMTYFEHLVSDSALARERPERVECSRGDASGTNS